MWRSKEYRLGDDAVARSVTGVRVHALRPYRRTTQTSDHVLSEKEIDK